MVSSVDPVSQMTAESILSRKCVKVSAMRVDSLRTIITNVILGVLICVRKYMFLMRFSKRPTRHSTSPRHHILDTRLHIRIVPVPVCSVRPNVTEDRRKRARWERTYRYAPFASIRGWEVVWDDPVRRRILPWEFAEDCLEECC